MAKQKEKHKHFKITPYDEVTGEWLKKKIDENFPTQRAFSELIGVNFQEISSYASNSK